MNTALFNLVFLDSFVLLAHSGRAVCQSGQVRLAIFSPPYAGHLNPLFALAAALHARSHHVVFICIPDVKPVIQAAGYEVAVVGHGSHRPGTLPGLEQQLGALRGFAGMWGTGPVIHAMARMTDMLCRQAPAQLEALGIQAIVCDQLEAAGGLIARRLGLPYVSVANALMIEREPYIPPPFTPWAYARTRWARERNLGGYRVSDWMMRPLTHVIHHWVRRWQLKDAAWLQRLDHCVAALQIGQLVQALDFPREALDSTGRRFVYTGPLRAPQEDVSPWPQAPAAPYAFVSLGTLQGARFALLARITRACHDLGLACVVAHCGRLSAAQAAALPGAPQVFDFVPQRRVIRHAALVVSHGGLNTVLDAASLGVAQVVLPLAMEQGASAQRVQRAGVGRLCTSLRRTRIRHAMQEVLADSACRTRAAAMAQAAQQAGGAWRAAGVIEHACA